jgi:hypothetical protein
MDEPAAVVKWVDGTVLDTIWRIGEVLFFHDRPGK